MPNRLSVKSLLKNFKTATKEDWISIAAQESKKRDIDIIGELSWRDISDIQFSPYYDKSDLSSQSETLFRLIPPSNKHETRHWKNIAPIGADKINEIVQILDQGGDGILIELQQKEELNKIIELLNVLPTFQLNLVLRSPNISIDTLENLLNHHHQNKSSHSFIYRTSLSSHHYLPLLNNCRALGIFVEGMNNPLDEIVESLERGVRLIDHYSEKEHPLDKIFQQITFSLHCGTSFFSNIAKLKALRFLWYQVARAYEIDSYQANDLIIHARIQSAKIKAYEPHSTMIYAAPAALAAISAGANNISVYGQDQYDPLMSHVALQVSNLLAEESYMGRVVDPFAGSYFHEVQTSQYAQNAWSRFQQKIMES